jgi:ubiquinone/menaquinone biosynthesis C-methylase UbiE
MHEEQKRRRDAAAQFEAHAESYAQSIPHSSGNSLTVVTQLAEGRRYHRALDIGTGPGFTAFAVAPFCDQVVASDPAERMLQQVEQLADSRRLSNVVTREAYAEALPFADAEFDLVTCRTAAHHFPDLPKALAEMSRVLLPNGVLILVDTTAPDDRSIADWQDEIERRRDPSHVRNRPPCEWRTLLRDSSFAIDEEIMTTVELEMTSWLERSGTPSETGEALRDAWLAAPAEIKRIFQFTLDERAPARRNFTFSWPVYCCRAHREISLP